MRAPQRSLVVLLVRSQVILVRFVTSSIDQQYTAGTNWSSAQRQTLNPVGYRPRGFAAYCWDGPDAKSGTFRFSAIPCHSGARSSHVSRCTPGSGVGWSVGRFRQQKFCQ
jgi:hypothetical protein